MTVISGFSTVATQHTEVLDRNTIRAFLRLYYKVVADASLRTSLSYARSALREHTELPFTEAHPDGAIAFDQMTLLRQIAKVAGSISIIDVDKLVGSTTDETYLLQCCLAINQQEEGAVQSFGCEPFVSSYSKFGNLSTFPEKHHTVRPDYNAVFFGLPIATGDILNCNNGYITLNDSLCTWTSDSDVISVPAAGEDVFVAFSYDDNEIWITVMGDEVHDIIVPISTKVSYFNIDTSKYSRCIVSDMSDNILFKASLHSDPLSYMEALI